MCTDEDCEFITPEGNEISTRHQNSNMIRLIWETKPKNILIVKKPNDSESLMYAQKVAEWYNSNGGVVWMEAAYIEEMGLPFLQPLTTRVVGDRTFSETNHIDLCVSLGGDGTCLWASKLFQRAVPPMLSLALGSLGFLTLFDPSKYSEHLAMANLGNFYLSLRCRLICYIVKAADSTTTSYTEFPEDSGYSVLNEVVIDRGPSGSLVNLDCFCNDQFVTKVQGGFTLPSHYLRVND